MNKDEIYILSLNKKYCILIHQCVEEKRILLMEQLPINNGSGQSFGFVLYRKHVSEPKMLTFPGKVRDRAIVSYVTFV